MPKKVPVYLRGRRKSEGRASSSLDLRVRSTLAYPTLAGPAINEHTALSITAVYSAVTIISNAIACLDFGVAERLAGGGRRPAVEHPVYDLLHCRPNEWTTSYRFRQATMGHALTAGNSYWEIIRGPGRVPIAFHMLDPRNVDPRIDEAGQLVYRLHREQVDIPARDVVHIANFGWDGVRGYSPVALHRESLGLAKAQEQNQGALMGNSSQPNGFLKTSRTLKEQDKNRLRGDFEHMHRGTENAGAIGILDGDLDWVATSFSPADAQLLLSRAFSVAEVARMFNIPQHKIGLLDHATFSNIEQLDLEFYKVTILPWLTCIEQELDAKLFTRLDRRTFFTFFDIETLLRADTATTTAQDTADFGMGVKSINEIRARRGLNPLPDPRANAHWIPVNNFQAIEDMGSTTTAEKPDPVEVDSFFQRIEDRRAIEIEVEPKALHPTATPELTIARGLLANPIAKMIRQECTAARRASKRERFDVWAESFCPSHALKVSLAIGPVLQAVEVLTGHQIDARAVADAMAGRSLARFLDLAKTVEPDDLPGAVDRACNEWEADRAEAEVNALLDGAE